MYMSGADLKEGVNIDSRIPGSVLQAQNLLFDNVTNYSGHHADCMQNWGGPGQYRIDGLTCSTSYQGFMIQPHEGGKTTYGMDTEVADWRRINVRGAGTYKFFMGGASIPSTKKVILNDVWHSNRANGAPCNCYPHTYAPWQAIKVGTPPGGDFVTKLTAGYAYRSPGYQ
jgi:hypothetical protein